MCCLYTVTANWCAYWIPHMMMRKKLREKYNIKAGKCDDCPKTSFCGPCALCQETREIKIRGNLLKKIYL